MRSPEVLNFSICCLYEYIMLALFVSFVSIYCHSTVTAQPVFTNIELGFKPGNICVNPNNNNIYVADIENNSVAVIDGGTNEVIKTIETSDIPEKIGINTISNRIYVTHFINKSISVIDSLENSVIDIVKLENAPSEIGINSEMNLIYVGQVSNDLNDTLLIIDGEKNKIIDIIKMGMRIVNITVNTSSGLIYILSDSDPNSEIPFDNIVTVIDSSTNKIVSSFVGGITREPSVDIDVNPETNRIYVATSGFAIRGIINVFDGDDNGNIASINFDGFIDNIKVNPTTNHIFALKRPVFSDENVCSIDIIDGHSNEIINCIGNAGHGLFGIAINPVTNNVYVSDKTAARLITFSDAPIIIPPKEDCQAEIIEIVPDRITLRKGAEIDVNIKLTDNNGCPVINTGINAIINLRGRRSITLSSSNALTGTDGSATFSISANNNQGNARILFSANKLRKYVNVKIIK